MDGDFYIYSGGAFREERAGFRKGVSERDHERVVNDVSRRRVEDRASGQNEGRDFQERVRDASREAVVGDVIFSY